MAQDRPGGVHINYNTNDEQIIQIQCNYSTAPLLGLQGLASLRENSLRQFLTDQDDFFAQSVIPLLTEDDMPLGHDNPSSSSPDLPGSNIQFSFAFNGIESSQDDICRVQWPQHIPPNGDLPTSRSITAPSVASPQSPVEPSATGYLSSQDWSDFNSQAVSQFPFGGPEAVPYFPTSYYPIPPQSSVGSSPAKHLSSQELTDSNSQGFFQFPLGGNEHSQPGNGQGLFNPTSGAAGEPTSYVIVDSSPPLPVGPSPSGHLFSNDIRPQDLSQFGENEHSQPGNSQVPRRLLIPSSGAAGPPTSSTSTTASSAQSPLGSFAARPHVTTKDEVGSLQIRKASADRRKKDGIHHCMFDSCDSTFTESHNLYYHINAHLGLKSYKCTMCKFATAYPTSLGQHMTKRHPSSRNGSGYTMSAPGSS